MEDDCAGDAENRHQAGLTDEPLTHTAFGGDQRAGETVAVFEGDEREEVEVRELALQHEVDAEDSRGNDVYQAGRPLRRGGKDVGGCARGDVLNPFADGVDTESLSEGKMFELGPAMEGNRFGRSELKCSIS